MLGSVSNQKADITEAPRPSYSERLGAYRIQWFIGWQETTAKVLLMRPELALYHRSGCAPKAFRFPVYRVEISRRTISGALLAMQVLIRVVTRETEPHRPERFWMTLADYK